MDEELNSGAAGTEQESVEAGVSPANADIAASTATATTTTRSLDLNELQKLSSEELESLGRDFDLRLHSARPRHYHILDLIRAALSTGTTVTAEGFLDQVGDSFGLLRWPRLNFLPVPEDVCVPHAIIQQF